MLGLRPLALYVCCLVLPAAASAQPAAATPTSGQRLVLATGWEVRRDRFDYRFEHPSSYDTAEPVPHFYAQAYDADNHWLRVSADYAALGHRWTTEAGMALWGTGVGGDDDTFFQPGGDVVVYGTTAVTDLRSFSVAQRVTFGAPAGIRARVAYRYRRDRAGFRPSDTVIRHSMPPSETRFYNTARETTVSSQHEVQFGASRGFAATRGWAAVLAGDVAPLTLAHLVTRLPDKYGDREIAGIAKGLTVVPSITLSLPAGAVRLEVRAEYTRTWAYSRANRFTQHAAGLAVSVLFPAPR